jgi:molybdopterin-guanine dinucleotide biosynthesis protein A
MIFGDKQSLTQSVVPMRMGNDLCYFHPFELAFCGYSNSGKTTLMEKLVNLLSDDYRVGYVKHDAHSFKIDKEGKDTDRMWKQGAFQVLINDSTHHAKITRLQGMQMSAISHFAGCDFVFVEGWKKSRLPKILLIDEEQNLVRDFSEGDFSPVLALVGQAASAPWPTNLPCFHRDDTTGLAQFVLEQWTTRVKQRPLYGLILAGGRSMRMGEDKAFLRYNGIPQLSRLMKDLSECCDKVFISCRGGQYDGHPLLHDVPQISDRFLEMGPIGGILSAQMQEPNAAFLVVACDLPFVTSDVLTHLQQNRDIFKVATCYESNYEEGLPEPLCTIYEPRSRQALLEGLSLGYHCPRKVLINSAVKTLKQLRPFSLDNVNRPDEYRLALDKINI